MSVSPRSPSSSTEELCRTTRSASPDGPPALTSSTAPSPPPPKGRHAFAVFKNNLLNINPTAYMWVGNYSGNSNLCHRCSNSTEPVQALFWVVGQLDEHTLDSAARSYDAWTVKIRLSSDNNRALDALLKTGPFKTFTSPNRYSLLKAKATFSSGR
ncbi:hypothetical protein V8E54_003867 [Elaphomyces granulatus]